MALKRQNKFYRKNEAFVMRELGLKPTANSGSGWIEKEDGQNDYVICQLKSTDANSIKLTKLDLDKLLYNAQTAKKIPVFAVQFLQSNEVYLVIKPETLEDVAQYLDTGTYNPGNDLFYGIDLAGDDSESITPPPTIIKSSENARENFRKNNEEKFKKKERKAR